MARGRFIVIEGIDGAGTTTHTTKLAERLRSDGERVHATREPSDGPFGTAIRQILSGRLVLPNGGAPGWSTMALLFAADRMDHVEAEILPALADGQIVLSDRYDASSIAYQSITSGRSAQDAINWIRVLNQHAPRPDLTIVIEVSADAARARRESRGEAAQIYEQSEVQRALGEFYRDLPAHMPGDRIVTIDGSGTVSETHERLRRAYREAFPVESAR